jgi:hypothetical protein
MKAHGTSLVFVSGLLLPFTDHPFVHPDSFGELLLKAIATPHQGEEKTCFPVRKNAVSLSSQAFSVLPQPCRVGIAKEGDRWFKS